ncbi:uncharacterized protein I206_107816 [Kwoniella pini CBS 10737]|uniref:RRM Nup35-type domain-containing protein n=1 Tax=Kwoniella pini CBS 10737 TaxID=1296096 RepID=A0A1B9HYF6_9TREE|nr:uncharacterized protein I206_06149 [Kwoniella pini CBS 10737]OCF48281.1 hypothetical protein I206_06149 [Kwoniella pini CBS 10737]
MSNDWWTNSNNSQQNQNNYFTTTPQRQNSNLRSSTTTTRFSNNNVNNNIGDELDSEDLKMVDSIKFLPSFANSPAGKLALGTSPQNSNSISFQQNQLNSFSNNSISGGGGNSSSYNNNNNNNSPSSNVNNESGRRSPGISTNIRDRSERDSPRHHRRSLLHQNSQLGNSFINNGNLQIDEDMPPTASLRDSINGGIQLRNNNNEISTPIELPTPSSLIPCSNTTTLHIFGPPLEILSNLNKSYLNQFGKIIQFKKGPEGSNWFLVQFDSPISASFALKRHGDILNGKYMIGFKVFNENSLNGCTLSSSPTSSSSNQNQNSSNQNSNSNSQIVGTPIKIQEKSIIKNHLRPQQQQQQQIIQKKNNNNEYNWDDNEEQQTGWSGWVSERLITSERGYSRDVALGPAPDI